MGLFSKYQDSPAALRMPTGIAVVVGNQISWGMAPTQCESKLVDIGDAAKVRNLHQNQQM